jgi:hypothetical protein
LLSAFIVRESLQETLKCRSNGEKYLQEILKPFLNGEKSFQDFSKRLFKGANPFQDFLRPPCTVKNGFRIS